MSASKRSEQDRNADADLRITETLCGSLAWVLIGSGILTYLLMLGCVLYLRMIQVYCSVSADASSTRHTKDSEITKQYVWSLNLQHYRIMWTRELVQVSWTLCHSGHEAF